MSESESIAIANTLTTLIEKQNQPLPHNNWYIERYVSYTKSKKYRILCIINIICTWY